MKRKRSGITGLLFLANMTLLTAQQPDQGPVKYAGTITAADLKTHLEILASDAYEGRETGQKGQKMAAEYIAGRFKAIGIPPLSTGGYYQDVPLIEKKLGEGSMKSNTSEFRFGADFFYGSGIDDMMLKSDGVLFIGYGLNEKTYNDYANVDVKGKVLLMLSGEPHDKNGRSLATGKMQDSTISDRRNKLSIARDHGAAAVLFVMGDYSVQYEAMRYTVGSPTLRLDMQEKQKEVQAPLFFISPGMADALLLNGGCRETVQTITARISKKKKPFVVNLPQQFSINVQRTDTHVHSENVLGFLEGSDLKNEIVVVTAHYDHIGKEGSMVFNGADDDGSGTVAVLEMAEAFAQAKKEGHGPRRSILFMTVTGEEKGLLGSRWYSENPVFPLEQTVCDLNIDMIGRIDEAHRDKPNYVYIIGSDKLSSELHAINETANKTYTQLDLDYKYNNDKDPNRFYYRSDHYNFAKKGIPIIFYFNGTHPDYHKETDEVQKIDFTLEEKRARLVFYTAWELANRDARIVVDKKK